MPKSEPQDILQRRGVFKGWGCRASRALGRRVKGGHGPQSDHGLRWGLSHALSVVKGIYIEGEAAGTANVVPSPCPPRVLNQGVQQTAHARGGAGNASCHSSQSRS